MNDNELNDRINTRIIAEIRTKHPLFSKLEQAVRVRYPLLSDFQVTCATIQFLEQSDAEECERMEDSNPGVARVQ